MSAVDEVATPLWPLDDKQRAGIESLIAQLDEIGEKVGGWTTKSQARQKGCSVYFTFDKKGTVFSTMEFIEMLQQAPAMLTNACERLIAADDAWREADADG